jgi:hypothetical protein
MMRLLLLVVAVSATVLSWRVDAEPAPATRPGAAPPVHVELPSGWEAKPPVAKTILQYATYPELGAYFQLIAEPKSDFAKKVDLLAWAKMVKENSAKTSTLAKREETALKQGKIGERATVEYEITGEAKDVKFHFRIIMVEFAGQYCKVVCWTTPSHWEAAQPKFEELVKQLKS